jgi:hypothetical protein
MALELVISLVFPADTPLETVKRAQHSVAACEASDWTMIAGAEVTSKIFEVKHGAGYELREEVK